MAKKKKYTLELEPEYDFDLIGICSHHSDYRLAWGINEHLGLHLVKCDENFELMNKKGEVVSSHSMYSFQDEENRIDYYLIKNLNQGKYAVPENTSIDYFLFLCNNHAVDPMEVIGQLKEVNSILGAYSFEPEELDSAENFVFS